MWQLEKDILSSNVPVMKGEQSAESQFMTALIGTSLYEGFSLPLHTDSLHGYNSTMSDTTSGLDVQYLYEECLPAGTRFDARDIVSAGIALSFSYERSCRLCIARTKRFSNHNSRRLLVASKGR